MSKRICINNVIYEKIEIAKPTQQVKELIRYFKRFLRRYLKLNIVVNPSSIFICLPIYEQCKQYNGLLLNFDLSDNTSNNQYENYKYFKSNNTQEIIIEIMEYYNKFLEQYCQSHEGDDLVLYPRCRRCNRSYQSINLYMRHKINNSCIPVIYNNKCKQVIYDDSNKKEFIGNCEQDKITLQFN